MTTCPLCGQRDHNGPCYADLKEEWWQQDGERYWRENKFTMEDLEQPPESFTSWAEDCGLKFTAA